MSRRELEVFLWDVVDSGEKILEYTRGESFEDYMQDAMLRDAVERRFTIVGEALSQARKLQGDLPLLKARGSIAFRNVLVHAYREINHEEVWRIIREELPLLLDEVRLLLGPTPA